MANRLRALLGASVFLGSVALAFWISRHRGGLASSTAEFAGPNGQRMTVQLLGPGTFRFDVAPFDGPQDLPRLVEAEAVAVPGFKSTSSGFETSVLLVTVDKEKLCLDVFDKAAGVSVAEICPQAESHALSLRAPLMTHVYGLGEQFVTTPGLNWIGKVRTPGREVGNIMVGFEKGWVENAQFPILYALGKGDLGFALLYDNTYAQTWDFRDQPWTATATGGPVRGYFMGGASLPDLRREFLRLSGRPPVPPRKAFGLWISEYGFENWAELEGKLRSLKQNGFPVDGFVLDLQWFGGIQAGSETSGMGGLQWDRNNFPDPKGKMKELADQGIGIIAIEEPFISRGTVDEQTGKVIHQVLAEKGYLATEGSGPDAPPTRLDPKAWWGNGGILDYIQTEAGDFWHDWKRQPLIEAGLMGHWTDLGEPEAFTIGSYYDKGRFPHAAIHNIYNRRWSESLFRGYQRHHMEQRPWILSRSGTIGSQRFGVGMWSGDIGSNLESLAGTVRAHAHVSLSGIDYFGSDVGGFHRKALRGSLNEMYTQWLANSSLFDVPIRPHTLNLCNCNETAPDRVGDTRSNLENLRRRYSLNPYYYSLAHAAWKNGDALIAPLVYNFQTDPEARDIGDEKMIGPFLLAASVAKENIQSRDVYLPAGVWFDYETGAPLVSRGEWFKDQPVRRDGLLRLPLYAREGALLPLAQEDGRGHLRVFPSKTRSEFVLVEDDGRTQAYLNGARRATRFTQVQTDGVLKIEIGDGRGSFTGAPAERAWVVDVVTAAAPRRVTLNGTLLAQSASAENSWAYQDGHLRIQLGSKPVERALKLRVESE